MRFIKNWWKNNRQILKFIGIVFLLWEVSILSLVIFGQDWWPTRVGYLCEFGGLHLSALERLANFDGIHYLEIARKGYGLYQQAFFPLYPMLISLLTPLFGGRGILAGMHISVVCLFIALWLLYKLARLLFSDRVAKTTVVFTLIFPASFYFSGVYTESLFLMLVLASFYFAKKGYWILAGLTGATASAVRLPGVFLLPALLMEWWDQNHKEGKTKSRNCRQNIKDLLGIFLVPTGLILYMRFLQVNYQDPLLFFHVQPHFGTGRSADKIILLYQVFWRYLKMLLTVDKLTTTYFVVVLETGVGILFLFLTLVAFYKKWYSYAIFMALSYLAPTLTGTFSSMPRYVLVLFPGFILLALWAEKHRWLKIIYPLTAIPLLIFSLILFSHGWWVA